MNFFEDIAKKVVDEIKCSKQSCEFILSGPIESGKTSILKEILKSLHIDGEYFVLYIPNYFNKDQGFIQSLFLSTYEKSLNTSLSYIQAADTLKKYLTMRKIFNHAVRQLFRMINVATSHMKNVSTTVIDDKEYDNSYTSINSINMLNIIIQYIRKLTRKKKVILGFDNYQDNSDLINIFVNGVAHGNKKNLYLIFAITTYKHNTVLPSHIVNNKIYNLDYPNEDDIKMYLKTTYQTICDSQLNTLAKIFYKTTKGHYGDFCAIIQKNDAELKAGNYKQITVLEKNDIYESLDEIQRLLLFISAVFPEGLKKQYIYDFFNNYNSVNTRLLDSEIDELIKYNILIYNGTQGDSLKAVNYFEAKKFKETDYTDRLIEYINSIKSYLSEILSKPNMQNYEYSYLLQCAVLLYKTKELELNIDKVITLINLNYSFARFDKIVELYDKIINIIDLLPYLTITKILDSFQKNSEFEKGLTIVRRICKNQSETNCDIRLYEIKFLTQLYEYDTALSLINNISEYSNEYYYVKLNILQQQFKNVESKQLIETVRNRKTFDKWYYIILRNAAHLYKFEDAEKMLLECKKYFHSKFELATVENNLGVIYLWNNNYKEASKCFNKAIKSFRELNSPEIFEPLCNNAVLKCLVGKFEESQANLDEAELRLPKSLLMDSVLLQANRIVINYIFDRLNKNDAVVKLNDLIKNYIFYDKWTEFLVQYNISILGRKTNIIYDSNFLKYLNSSESTHFEIFYNYNGYKLLLGLSPHWRY